MSKKEQVIITAREMFSTYGYQKVSMDDIAKNSNVTKKTIYTYFKDKDDLLKYFILEEINRMKNHIDEIEKNKNDIFDIVHETLYYMLSYTKESKLINILQKESKLKKNLTTIESINMIEDMIIKYIEERLDKALKLNYINKCNTKVTAYIIYTVYKSLIFDYNKPLDEKEFTDNLTTILKNGLFKGEDNNEK